jgi:hypothetical protein
MADIKQAVRWLANGEAVRRRGWSPNPADDSWHERIELHDRSNQISAHRKNSPIWGATSFSPEDLLAHDWEIAE